MDVEVVAAASSALLAQGFLSEAGKSAWQGTTALLETVRRRFRGDRNVESTLERMEQDPRNEDVAARMTQWLAATMIRDAHFFDTMKRFVDQASNSPVASEVVSRTYNNYQNAKIEKIVNIDTVHGDLNF
ncbi:hypothetical protein [Streptomyces sp. NPDC046976]|uniref:hypothetical protein n=1 Tax=Streptomyces sp. NPDC046976 TaxID=3155258 RepID=UPI003406AE56